MLSWLGAALLPGPKNASVTRNTELRQASAKVEAQDEEHRPAT